MTNALTVFQGELVKKQSDFAMVLPQHLPPERFQRTVLSAVARDMALLDPSKTDRASLWRACMSAATFGLEIDNRLSCVVRYGRQAQWIPMVAGLVALAQNGGWLVQGDLVRKMDDFDYTRGLHPDLQHKPAKTDLRGGDNPIVAAYATAWSNQGFNPIFEVMQMPEILKVRDNSAGYKFAESGPANKGGGKKNSLWHKDFAAMARKTPIRALANHLPWQVQKAIELETRHDEGKVASAAPGDDGTIIVEATEVPEAGDWAELEAEHARQQAESAESVTDDRSS